MNCAMFFQRQTQAAVIYDRHLSMRAAEQVNVDSQARKDTEDRLSSPAPDMFNIPQRQVGHDGEDESIIRD